MSTLLTRCMKDTVSFLLFFTALVWRWLTLCPIVRIGPNKLHIKHPKAHYTLYRRNDVVKDRDYYEVGFGSATGLMPDGKLHKHRRKHMIKSLSMQVIGHLDAVIRLKADQLSARAKEHAISNNPLNLSDAYRSLGHDIMTALFFGHGDDCLASPNFSHDLHMMSRGLFRFLDLVHQFRFLPRVLKIVPAATICKLIPSMRYSAVRQSSRH